MKIRMHPLGFPLSKIAFTAGCLAALSSAGWGTSAQAQWIGAVTGTGNDAAHSFLNTANWTGGVVSDTFGNPTLTGGTTLYFNNNHATTGLWDLTYAGAADLLLQSTVGPFTVTLGGDVSATPGSVTGQNRTLTIGSLTAGSELALDLGGVQRTFTVSTSDTLTLNNALVGATAGLIKAGGGTLRLLDGSTLGGPISITGGTLRVDSATPLAAGATVSAAGSNFQVRGAGGTTTTLSNDVSLAISGSTSAEIQAFRLSGTGLFTLDVTGAVSVATTQSQLRYEGDGRASITQTGAVTMNNTGSGSIVVDGTGTIVNLNGGLTKAGTNQQMEYNPQNGTLNLNSDVSHGTGLSIVNGATTGVVAIDAATRLGAGAVRIDSGGLLLLNYDGALPGSSRSFNTQGGGALVFGQAQTTFSSVTITAGNAIGGDVTGAVVGTSLNLATDAALIADGAFGLSGLTLTQAGLGVTGKTFWRAVTDRDGVYEIGTTVNGASDVEGIYKGMWFGAGQEILALDPATTTGAASVQFVGTVATPVGSGDDLQLWIGSNTRFAAATTVNSDTGIVDALGNDTLMFDAAPGGNFNVINRTADFAARNNTIFRAGTSTTANAVASGVTVNVENGRFDLDHAGGVAAGGVVNINANSTLNLDVNPTSGTFNLADGTNILLTGSGGSLGGGATYNFSTNHFLILERTMSVNAQTAALMPDVDIVFYNGTNRDLTGAGVILGQDKRLMTSRDQNGGLAGASTGTASTLTAEAGATRVILSAANSRTLTLSQLAVNLADQAVDINPDASITTIVGNNVSRVTATQTGTVSISGVSAGGRGFFAGSVDVHRGTLVFAGGGMPYVVGGGTGELRVRSGANFRSTTGALVDGALQVDAGGIAQFTVTSTPSAGSIAGAGNILLGNTLAGTGIIPFAVGSNNMTTEFSGVISQVNGFTGALTKTGTGALTLSGTSTYQGTTTVSNGALLVNGALNAGGGLVTVAAAGTLGGTGTINRAVTVNGTLAPGASPGTLDVAGALALGNNATLAIELGGATPGDGSGFYDQVNMTAAGGSVSIGTNVDLDVSLFGGFTGTEGDAFYILTREDGGVYGNTFAGLAEGGVLTVGASQFTITYEANWAGSQGSSSLIGGNDVALVLSAVPEPSTFALLGLLGSCSLWYSRRRRAAGVPSVN